MVASNVFDFGKLPIGDFQLETSNFLLIVRLGIFFVEIRHLVWGLIKFAKLDLRCNCHFELGLNQYQCGSEITRNFGLFVYFGSSSNARPLYLKLRFKSV